ncbi:MAG: hypothetical protein H6Q73_2402 [Firmicutes bacterium]|nr:hypothetical protein [Bacillota bacterium]
MNEQGIKLKDSAAKQIIYYFSATGNSLYAAKTISQSLPNCPLISIASANKEETVTTDAESIGFVFPMHYFGMPPIVAEFISKLDMKSVGYVFAIVTCGNHYFSSAFNQLNKLLVNKGKKLTAGFHVEMISNYIPLSNLPPQHKQDIILTNADNRLKALAEIIRIKIRTIETEYFWLPCSAINSFWRKSLLPKNDRKFSSSAGCTSCGICEKICPVDNIRLVNGRPEWKSHCQECLACLHFCPEESIEFGRTAGRLRYHHPFISRADIITSNSR